jgi:hypothetical protein
LKKLSSGKLDALFVPKPMAVQFFAKPCECDACALKHARVIWKAARFGRLFLFGDGLLFPNYSR